MDHRVTTAIATAFVRYGSFVAIDGDHCSPDPTRAGVGGIAKRPHHVGLLEGYEAGELVTVLVEGGVQADLAEGQRWAEVKGGRVLPR